MIVDLRPRVDWRGQPTRRECRSDEGAQGRSQACLSGALLIGGTLAGAGRGPFQMYDSGSSSNSSLQPMLQK
jgi:hypothetical protein